MTRGYCGIGVYHPKTEANIGTLWRSAHILGADFLFTVGHRYRRQASDTTKAWMHLPLFHFATVDDLVEHLPHACPLVGVELDPRARMLSNFTHEERSCYMLGAEDSGIPLKVLDRCHRVVRLPGAYCLNVAVAGSIVLYHRKEAMTREPLSALR